MNQSIYLLASKKRNDDVYKVGKTKRHILTRIGEYKNEYGNPDIKGVWCCYDADNVEKDIIAKFKKIFIREKKLEYFRGDLISMISIIQKVVDYHNIEYLYIEKLSNGSELQVSKNEPNHNIISQLANSMFAVFNIFGSNQEIDNNPKQSTDINIVCENIQNNNINNIIIENIENTKINSLEVLEYLCNLYISLNNYNTFNVIKLKDIYKDYEIWYEQSGNSPSLKKKYKTFKSDLEQYVGNIERRTCYDGARALGIDLTKEMFADIIIKHKGQEQFEIYTNIKIPK